MKLVRNKVKLNVRKVKKACKAVQPLNAISPILAPMPTNNEIAASMILAIKAFQFELKLKSQCRINPEPIPKKIAENTTNKAVARPVAKVAIIV